MFSRNTVPGDSRTLTLAQACSIIKEVATVTSIWRGTTKAAGGRRRDRPDGKCLRARRPQARTGPMTTTCFQSLVPTADRAGTGTTVDLSVDVCSHAPGATAHVYGPSPSGFPGPSRVSGGMPGPVCRWPAAPWREPDVVDVRRESRGSLVAGVVVAGHPRAARPSVPRHDRPGRREPSVLERARFRNRLGRLVSLLHGNRTTSLGSIR